MAVLLPSLFGGPDRSFCYVLKYKDECLKTKTAPQSVLLSLTGQFLLPGSNKDLALLDSCDCLGCFRFSDPNPLGTEHARYALYHEAVLFYPT